MEVEDGVLVVQLSGEEGIQLFALGFLPEFLQGGVEVFRRFLVTLLQQFYEYFSLFEPAGQFLPVFQLCDQPVSFLQGFRRPFAVIPEVGFGNDLFQLRSPFFLGRQLKDTSLGSRTCPLRHSTQIHIPDAWSGLLISRGAAYCGRFG
jgi:hypothetical protein